MNEDNVTGLIAAMRRGDMTLEEVAEKFRHRRWPRTRRRPSTTYEEMADQQDPEPDVPGSYDDLTAAYDRGELTREQYRTLVSAAAESIRSQSLGDADS